MHGYLFPMPIAPGPFPHPSYDTTAGEFLSCSPSSSFPSDQAEIYDACKCCGSPIVNACGQAWPRLSESSFTKWPCLVDCPEPCARRDVLPHLLSSGPSHAWPWAVHPPAGCSAPALMSKGGCQTLSLPPPRLLGGAVGKGLQPHGQIQTLRASKKNNFCWAAGLWQPSADSFPESDFLGELWCWFVARQNKQTLENQLKTKLLEDPRKWLAYF